MKNERAILLQAAEWFAILGDAKATADERRQWREWIKADAAHARAWQRVEMIGQPFRQVGAVDAKAGRETLLRAGRIDRRRVLRALSAGGVFVGGGMLLHRALPWPQWAHDARVAFAAERTAIGERRTLTLGDGTRLALNTASAVDIEFDARARRIVLHAGEVHIASAPDTQTPKRPLFVEAPCARLLALGTRFSVRADRRGGQLAVFDGAVRVGLADGALTRDIGMGRQVHFSATAIRPDERADPAREGWLHGQLIADDITLRAFIDELGSYTPVRIRLDPALAALRLVGVYSIAAPQRDVPRILAALETVLPVRIAPQGGEVAIVPR